ncbi:ankyrin repeat domain-containing protein [Candidatus Dependentiae bacterium]
MVKIISRILLPIHLISLTVHISCMHYKTDLRDALLDRDFKKLKSILDTQQININTPVIINNRTMEARYPLEISAEQNNIRSIIYLLQHEAKHKNIRSIIYFLHEEHIFENIIKRAIIKQNMQAFGIFLASLLHICSYQYLERNLEGFAYYAEEFANNSEGNYIYSIIWDVLNGKKLYLQLPKIIEEELLSDESSSIVDKKSTKEYTQLVMEILKLKRSKCNKKQREKEIKKINALIKSSSKNTFKLDRDTDGYYILHFLAEYVPEETIPETMNNQKIDVNVSDDYNRTPAYLLVKKIINLLSVKAFAQEIQIQINALKSLLQNGANPCIRTHKSSKSLWTAVIPYKKIFAILLDNSNLNCIDPQTGDTALHQIISTQSHRKRVIKSTEQILKKLHNSTVNKGNFAGITPLHLAIIHQKTEIIKTLMNHKADPDQKCCFGESPHDMLKSLYDNNKIFPRKYKKIEKLIDKNKQKL